MNILTDRHDFHYWNEENGTISFPNMYEISTDNASTTLRIYTAKRNGKWYSWLKIILIGLGEIVHNCTFRGPSFNSEHEAFAAQMKKIQGTGTMLPKSWWRELNAHLASLHGR